MDLERVNMDKLLELDLEKETLITPCSYALSMVNDLIAEMDNHTLQLNERKADIYRHQEDLRYLGGERMAVVG